MEDGKITVFIVDDSPLARDLLTYIIEKDPSLKIIGFAENGEEALVWLKYQTPDVITMDIMMPVLDGFDTTRRIMQTKPTPIVIVSSGYNHEDWEKSFMAIEAGALAIIQKPQGIYDNPLINELLETIHLIAGSKLITRRKSDSRVKLDSIPSKNEFTTIENGSSHQASKGPIHHSPIQGIAIGASLGGPMAVEKIISSLPENLPVPIFVVQHISIGFTKGFAEWLQRSSKLKVKLAENLEQAVPGCVYVAPDACFMTIHPHNIIKLESMPADNVKFGIGKLFESMAKTYGENSIGVILTGMGKDGSTELLEMYKNGALTIAQNEESCVLFGMPKEAIRIGAAGLVLHLDNIAETLVQAIQETKRG